MSGRFQRKWSIQIWAFTVSWLSLRCVGILIGIAYTHLLSVNVVLELQLHIEYQRIILLAAILIAKCTWLLISVDDDSRSDYNNFFREAIRVRAVIRDKLVATRAKPEVLVATPAKQVAIRVKQVVSRDNQEPKVASEAATLPRPAFRASIPRSSGCSMQSTQIDRGKSVRKNYRQHFKMDAELASPTSAVSSWFVSESKVSESRLTDDGFLFKQRCLITITPARLTSRHLANCLNTLISGWMCSKRTIATDRAK